MVEKNIRIFKILYCYFKLSLKVAKAAHVNSGNGKKCDNIWLFIIWLQDSSTKKTPDALEHEQND